MKVFRQTVLAALTTVVFSTPLAAAAPVVSHLVPSAVAPGTATEVTIFGKGLVESSGLWTSLPPGSAATKLQVGEGEQVGYSISVPESVAVGIYGVRLATKSGISNMRLLMVDDLASVISNETNGNVQTAQPLEFPVAVDGACEAERYDYFRFRGRAGQRLSVEVVARRLGSPLDPVVRLIDSSGHELAYSDDEEGLSGDARFALVLPRDETYWLELRDVRYEGGGDFRYRLRIGDFPLATIPFPLGGHRGSRGLVTILGPHVARLPKLPFDFKRVIEGPTQWLAARYQDGSGSTFVPISLGDMWETVEIEPNDTQEGASPLGFPCRISGRFATAKDRDYYRFDAKKGQHVRFVGRTRTLGSPSDLFMRILGPGGKKLAEVDDDGENEGAIDVTFPADGSYLLMVEDLLRRGGVEHGYRMEVDAYRPDFRLSVDAEKVDVPTGGVFAVKVTASRRGYNGPIELSLVGLDPPWTLHNNVIPKGKKETLLTATAPEGVRPGRWWSVRVAGHAKIGDETYRTFAENTAALRTALRGLPYPPAHLNGRIGLGVGGEFPDFFDLALDADHIAFAQLFGKTSFEVTAKKRNKFDGPISIAVEGLPSGFSAEVKPISKGNPATTVTIHGPIAPVEGEHTVRIIGTAVYQQQPKKVVLANIPFRVVPPVAVDLAGGITLDAGGSRDVNVRLTRYNGHDAPVRLRWRNLPHGVSSTGPHVVSADKLEATVALSAAQDVSAREGVNVYVEATTTINGREVTVTSPLIELRLRKRSESAAGAGDGSDAARK